MEAKKQLTEDTESKKVFNIKLPLPLIDRYIDEIAEEKQKTYKLDGFRAGKVPVDEIKKREKANLFYEATEKVINKTANEIVKENDYKLASPVAVDVKKFDVDNDVEVIATIEIMPKISDIDLKKITIDQYKVNVTEKDIDSSIDRILSSYKKWNTKNAPAENGDITKINFVGYVNGEEFSGNRGEEFNLQLGSGTFIKGFEEQLIGAKAGDKITVKTKFPNTYHAITLAGKDVEFDVEVLEVSEASPIELDDEFVKKTFGIDTVATFRENVKKELENSYDNISRFKCKEQLVNKLNESVNFALPENALKNRIESMKKYRGQNIETGLTDEQLKNEAERSLKCGYILESIAEKNKIEVNDSDVTESITKEAQSMVGNEQMVIDFYKNNPASVNTLKAQLLENKVINFIFDNVNKNRFCKYRKFYTKT